MTHDFIALFVLDCDVTAVMTHELCPLEQTSIEKFYFFRDYSNSDQIVFKIPTDSEFPRMLKPHLEKIKNVIKQIEQHYTQAEVLYSFII